MITTGALLHGKVARHLDFDPAEEPVALQLGGSEPQALAESARLGEQWGYSEINLNCGCPSERVQRGSFGACLMAEPDLVADCMKAMLDAVSIPVTVKHRLGLDYNESYDFVRDFVGKIYDTGCRVFVVHARNAVLKGLSPKDNREKPPLRYEAAARLKADFPDCTIVLNGGINEAAHAAALMEQFDGVMLGRAAWHNPGVLSEITRLYCADVPLQEPAQVVQAMVEYAGRQIERGVPLRLVVRSMLGWMSGRQGARLWRRTLSDHSVLNRNDPLVIEQAWSDLKLRALETT
jgi:tRNA-dihydrouridine synthase A